MIRHDYLHLPSPAQLPAHHRAQRFLKEATWWTVRAVGITVLAGLSFVLGAFSGGWLA